MMTNPNAARKFVLAKSSTRLLLFGLIGLLVLSSRNVKAQSTEIAKITKDGVTVHILQAGFYPTSKISLSQMKFSEPSRFGARQRYAVWYRLESSRFKEEDLERLDVKGRLQTPEGDMVENDIGERGVVAWTGVNPAWTSCSVELSFQMPETKAVDQGKFTTRLFFKDVPLPLQLDQSIFVNRSLATPGGTYVTLIKTARERINWPMGSETYVRAYFKFATSAPVTDATFLFSKVIDENGVNLVATSSGGSRASHEFTLHTGDVTRLLSSRADMTIDVEENVPFYKQDKTVRFPFLILPIPASFSNVSNPTPLLQSSTRSVIAKLEPWRFNGAIDMVYSWLWLQDRGAATDGNRRWFAVKGTTRDDKGRTRDLWPGGNTPPFYLSTGERAPANSQATELGVRVENENRATKLSISLQVEPRRVAHHVWDFDIPIPAVNQDASASRQITAKDGTPMTLKFVRNFAAASQLLGREDSAPFIMDRGLAVVVQWFPVMGDKANTLLSCNGAYDITGEEWDKTRFASQVGGDMTQPRSTWDKKGKTETFFFTIPPKSASLHVRLSADESLADGSTETIEFNDIGVPKFVLDLGKSQL